MRPTAVLICVWLAVGSVRAAEPAGKSSGADASKPTADAGTLKLVNFFIKAETADLPPSRVGDFIAVDPESLPKKLRAPFLAKKEELLALKRIADGNKKAPVRRLGQDDPVPCAKPDSDPKAAWILQKAGFGEIYDNEVMRLMQDTKCSACELETEFTLKRVMKDAVPAAGDGKPLAGKAKAKGPPEIRYFLHERDPLFALIGAYRGGKNAFGTNFFGLGTPHCH